MPNKDKPHVGARVSTRHRVIAGAAHNDTGTITRLEDGGYCVVRWDSDGESTSVLMMSLRPLSPDDELARVQMEAHNQASRVTTMPPETSITAERTAVNQARLDLAKESRLLREWLDFLDRAIDNNGGVIHWVLIFSINESCAKLTYLAGRVNEDLLK